MADEPKNPDDQFLTDVPLHELFQKQVMAVLEESDMDEQAKQAILVALNCPCCGTGGMSYTAPIKRKKK